MVMRVPFVLIKKDRTSTLRLSHTAKRWLEHPSHREALSLGCIFTDNVTLFFMTPEPLS